MLIDAFVCTIQLAFLNFSKLVAFVICCLPTLRAGDPTPGDSVMRQNMIAAVALQRTRLAAWETSAAADGLAGAEEMKQQMPTASGDHSPMTDVEEFRN
jgi:hypothetical protein